MEETIQKWCSDCVDDGSCKIQGKSRKIIGCTVSQKNEGD